MWAMLQFVFGAIIPFGALLQAWIPLLTFAACVHGRHLGDHVLCQEGTETHAVCSLNNAHRIDIRTLCSAV